jgi:hypothetical protein
MGQGSTEELRGRDYVQALLARATARAARAAANPGATFVFRPGGIAGANVYTDWPSLMAARAQIQGQAWIQIDDSIVSPATVPAGAWNLDNGASNFNDARGTAALVIDDGVEHRLHGDHRRRLEWNQSVVGRQRARSDRGARRCHPMIEVKP